MKFKGVLFDLDGTLLDTSELIVRSFQYTFRLHYDRDLTVAEVHQFFGKPLRAAMEHYGPDKVDKLITTYRDYNLAHHDNLTTTFTGVIDVIQNLYSAGILMAIVTSKTKETALRGLRLFDLDNYFSVVIGVHQCSNHKPHPEPVLKALEHLNLLPEACLMVGDSPFDILSAKQAGTKTAAVRWTQVPWNTLLAEQPDYVIGTMSDLFNICDIRPK